MPDTNPIPRDCVVFDTETTGLDPHNGDRIVEIGAVRMLDGLPTHETFHRHINPERRVPDNAVKVHGLTTEFLEDKPLFRDIIDDFLNFIADRPLVAHNAGFDADFLNTELDRHGRTAIGADRFIDTVPIARRKLPGQKVSLDALCRKFKISLDSRNKHGALIDSELLAEVCVELNGGRQGTLFAPAEPETDHDTPGTQHRAVEIETFVRQASEEEMRAHAEMVARIPNALWNNFEPYASQQ